MKIIKRGKLKLQREFRGTCRKCKSIVEWTEIELSVECCPREGYEFAHAACPVCSSDIMVYPKK